VTHHPVDRQRQPAERHLAGFGDLQRSPNCRAGDRDRGSEGLGFSMAAMGTGAMIGTLVLAGRSDVADLSRVILYSSATLGAGFVLFSMARSFNLSLLLMHP
jgi:hypothetical protein